MRLLLVTNIPAPYTVDLINYMQNVMKSYDISVLYTSRNEDNRDWKIDEKLFKNTHFAKSKILKIKTRYDYRYIHIPTGIIKTINIVNPDVIIAWEYNIAAVLSLLWCKKNKRAFISLTEGTLLTESRLWFIQKMTRKLIIHNSNAFLVSGTKAKEKLIKWGVDSGKIFTELLTVDVDKYLRKERNVIPNRILYVGSLANRKGVDLLIEALPYLKSDYELSIVGNGSADEIDYLKNLAKDRKVEDRIKWQGFKQGEELVREYSEANVFVLPSREDCFGLVLLEALASRVPIVASIYADGAYDIVEPGKNGYMIDPYNPREIAEAIDIILKHSQYLTDFEINSLRIVEKFKYSEVIKGYLDAISYVKGEITERSSTQ